VARAHTSHASWVGPHTVAGPFPRRGGVPRGGVPWSLSLFGGPIMIKPIPEQSEPTPQADAATAADPGRPCAARSACGWVH